MSELGIQDRVAAIFLASLSDVDAELLTLRLLDSRRDRGATKEEISYLLAWARETRVMDTLLDLALEGRVGVDVAVDDNGELDVAFVPKAASPGETTRQATVK